MSLIDVRDLTRTFVLRTRAGAFRRARREVRAVHDLTFSVEAGEMIGYIGPNGAGKSTTIKMLTGILVPTTGHLRVAVRVAGQPAGVAEPPGRPDGQVVEQFATARARRQVRLQRGRVLGGVGQEVPPAGRVGAGELDHGEALGLGAHGWKPSPWALVGRPGGSDRAVEPGGRPD